LGAIGGKTNHRGKNLTLLGKFFWAEGNSLVERPKPVSKGQGKPNFFWGRRKETKKGSTHSLRASFFGAERQNPPKGQISKPPHRASGWFPWNCIKWAEVARVGAPVKETPVLGPRGNYLGGGKPP